MFRQVILAAAVAMPSAAAASTVGYSSFFVFGDSLSDPGDNLPAPLRPPSPPYDGGRFTNGLVWAQRTAAAFEAAGLPTENFAQGGAEAATDGDGIDDFAAQIDSFEATTTAATRGDRPLAAVWLGANDIFGGVEELAETGDFGAPGRAAAEAGGALSTGLDRLGALGVMDLLVFNLPALGETPLLSGTLVQGLSNGVTGDFNDALAADLAGRPDLTVTLIDIAGLFDELIDDPIAFGDASPFAPADWVIDDSATPCIVPEPFSFCGPAEARTRAFFDLVHPNATVHETIANAVAARVDLPAPIPLPAGAPLLLGGLAAIGALRVASRTR